MLRMPSFSAQQTSLLAVSDGLNAVYTLVTETIIKGRALGVGATETFDLRDDIEGLNGGIVMKQYVEGEAKGFMEHFGMRV